MITNLYKRKARRLVDVLVSIIPAFLLITESLDLSLNSRNDLAAYDVRNPLDPITLSIIAAGENH